MRYEMSAYVAACALQKPKPANFSTIIQVSSRCWLVSPIIPAAFRNFQRNRSRSLRPENFEEARRTRSASASDMLPSVCEICITCSWKIHTPSVSPRIVSSSGCANVISSSLRSRFKNNSFDPYSAAPGRISANACATSSSVRALIVRNSPRMAGDSIWKTPIVLPAAITSHVAGSFSDIVQRERHRGEAALAEQIHLDQAKSFDGVHVVLRHNDPFCRALQRRQPRQRPRGNHRSARMNSEMPRRVIEPQRHLENCFPRLVIDWQIAALRQIAYRRKNFAHRAVRQPFRKAVHFTRRHAKNFRYFAHRQPRVHGNETRDHGDVFRAPALVHIVEQFIAARAADIDVNVRAIAALLIQKSFKVQPPAQRAHA